jgi:chromosomal replication initiator protein
MRLRRDFTFDRFVPLPECSEAYRACVAVASGARRAPRALLLHGPVGKTHLLHAIGNAVLRRRSAIRLACLTAEELICESIDGLRRGKELDLGRKYSRYDLILIDDLSILAGRPKTQDMFADMFTAWHEARAHLVCTAVAPAQIKPLAARFRRLPGSRVVALKRPTQAGIRRILESMAKAQDLHLPRQALGRIARICGRDVRRAIGMLNHLRLESSRAGRPTGC